MRLISKLAPRLSRRRLVLSIMRDFWHRPSSLSGRLAPVNFMNARTCAGLQMHCCVCGHFGRMLYDYPDIRLRKDHGIGLLRETLRCRSCGSTMRDRQMAFGLLAIIGSRLGQTESDLRAFTRRPQGALSILDTDSFSSINSVLRGLPGYVYSQYRPDLPNGATIPDGSLNVNLEAIPFADASFDVMMTSDVMEHVPNDEAAHREIFRCLRAGGTYLFTVPYDPCIVGHRVLTRRTGPSSPPFILEHHIHGDPHAASGIIAHKVYGRQVFDDLRSIGYDIVFDAIDRPDHGIFGGDLFLASKKL